MDYDHILEQYLRKWKADPEDNRSLVDFMKLSQRLGRELPSNHEGIFFFTSNRPELVISYIRAMNTIRFGDPAYLAAVFRDVIGFETAMRLVEEARVGDPSTASFTIAEASPFEPTVNWAMGIIENATFGDPGAAVSLHYSHSLVDREWVRRIIETATTGDVIDAAWHFIYSTEWLKRIIETSELGDQPRMAWVIAYSYGMEHLTWAKKIVRRTRVGDPCNIATVMVSQGCATVRWAKNIIETAVVGDPVAAAQWLYDERYVSEKWYMKILARHFPTNIQ